MGTGFRAKVLLAITFITVLASIGISIAFLRRAEAVVQESYVRTISSSMTTSVNTFDESMQLAYNTAVALEFDPELTRLLDAYGESRWDLAPARQISAYLQSCSSGQSLVEMIYVYLPEAKQVITSVEYHAVQEIFFPDQHSWLSGPQKGSETGLSPLLVYDAVRRSPTQTLAFVRSVSAERNGAPAATVGVVIDERKLFYQCLSAMGLGSSDTYYLIDNQGLVVSAMTIGQIGASIHDVLPDAVHLPQDGAVVAIQGDTIVAAVDSPLTRFRMVGVTSRTDLMAQLRSQQMFTAGILALTLVAALVPAYWMTRRVYRPIEKLKAAMEEISGGNLDARAEIVSRDEIGQLSHGFNDMVDRIEELIEEVVSEQTQTRQAELDALQYQITPHFMYNTLNSIKFAAHLQGAQSIAEQIGAFTELLQASINRKGPFLTVQDEIHMVRNYIGLQQFRYMNQLSASYEIAEDTVSCCVPRLILQPLVENAVLHGQREGAAGVDLFIQTALTGRELRLTIKDNGRGMTERQIQKLLTSSKEPKMDGFSGIGVANIVERLRLYYGEKAGLTIDSEPGRGTTMCIRLPAVWDMGD